MRFALFVAALAAFIGVLQPAEGSPEVPHPPHVEPPRAAAPGSLYGGESDYAGKVWRMQVAQWMQAVEDAENFRAALARAVQAKIVGPGVTTRLVSAPSVVPPPPGPAPSGDCYDGSPIPRATVTRESGGDSTITNGGGHAASPLQSGGRAWGCYQLMPMHFQAGGSCEDITDYSVAGQQACASRLPSSAWST